MFATTHCTHFHTEKLPKQNHIAYKLLVPACTCYNAIARSAPSYRSELLHLCSPSRSLRSSPDTYMLKLQHFNHKTHDFCTFSHLPCLEQSPPRHQATLSSFKSKLKTFTLLSFPSKGNSRHFSS